MCCLADACFVTTVSLAASRPVCVMWISAQTRDTRTTLCFHALLHSTIAKLKLPVSCLTILYILLDLFLYIYSVQSISTIFILVASHIYISK